MTGLSSRKIYPRRPVVQTIEDERRADQLALQLMRELGKLGIKVKSNYTPDFIIQAFAQYRIDITKAIKKNTSPPSL